MNYYVLCQKVENPVSGSSENFQVGSENFQAIGLSRDLAALLEVVNSCQEKSFLLAQFDFPEKEDLSFKLNSKFVRWIEIPKK